ncbi:dihydrolipoamide acetyltransferase component of pyruvate dehydrogenase complex [Nocardiopsis terrae]|uniref:Dihydrolipoamide acetyltransferase component of pyruvate dehydrogenase complex n=1 Tax=Nocardiopsis terrae TaxID=372655 RepID=A0ABR9HA60_9ACTN|nr:dihydrolipoamide acetyltransferase family protein [Nocardiopsis terrae]MBE1455903.1 pyruvate dehydrogenase E2 component (dihydrolipoamide acetyltransferase) [Nocardiopsis terrae]GHC98438.1 dihydrolipoamide acetyltransferase component of pyruvate dehydrogenase complex [Nocardiopsis terrae]
MAIHKSTPAVDGVQTFKLPDVGEGLVEAELLTWYVKPGDTVADGQMICEIETAKAVVELPCPFAGTVRELLAAEGETVEVGSAIITVDDGTGGSGGGAATDGAAEGGAEETEEREKPLVGYGEKATSTQRRARRRPAPSGPVSAPPPKLTEPAPANTPGVMAASAGPEPASGRPLAKPPVRKLAKDLGVDLATVTPTGKGGIVTREDVHAAAGAEQAPSPAAAAPEAAPAPDRTAREVRVPVKGVRKHTAAAMVNSAFTAPHVTEFLQVDVTRTMKAVARLRERPDFADVKVSPLLLVAKALLMAVRRHPEVNASWDEENQEIVVKNYVNLGIAAATERGLVVPNIKDADSQTLPELAASLKALTETARSGKTSPADMSGGTITVTNVGVFGVDAGTPIINPGEAAILAFGQIRDMPWVHKGELKIRKVTTLSLSFDHRLVDGELGSKVLRDIGTALEDPELTALAWG